MANRTIHFDDCLHEYLLSVSTREPELFRRLREETYAMPESSMQIAPEQGQFMQLLVELIGAKTALEVGVFTGYSALCVASALPADGRLVACDVSAEWTGIARRYWKEAGLDSKIDLRIGPALDTLQSLRNQNPRPTFDFAFIDADKQNYDAYYELALELLRPGGLIAIDNVLWSGKVADPTEVEPDTVAIRNLNRKIAEDERVSMSLVPIGDGLTLARKR